MFYSAAATVVHIDDVDQVFLGSIKYMIRNL